MAMTERDAAGQVGDLERIAARMADMLRSPLDMDSLFDRMSVLGEYDAWIAARHATAMAPAVRPRPAKPAGVWIDAGDLRVRDRVLADPVSCGPRVVSEIRRSPGLVLVDFELSVYTETYETHRRLRVLRPVCPACGDSGVRTMPTLDDAADFACPCCRPESWKSGFPGERSGGFWVIEPAEPGVAAVFHGKAQVAPVAVHA